MRTPRTLFLILFLITGMISLGSWATPHHHLEVGLAPAIQTLMVTDHLSGLPVKSRFRLHKNLQIQVLSPGAQLQHWPTPADQPYQEFELTLATAGTATLQYSGLLFEPVVDNTSRGLISPDGAVLFGGSFWLPDFSVPATFEVANTHLPPGWIWASPRKQTELPQQEIPLVAGPFHQYTASSQASPLPLKVFLRSPDPLLAQTYLSLLPAYLEHYQTTLGPYPYESFAVVENFWETGFGLPGFTLLGSGVIRIPSILNSSLPHELLHNWWGNSVYVDESRGNWCEGLTTYLADHWQQELLQTDREYRRQALMNFQDYTKSTPDIPLSEFKGRFNFASQAIGYGKGMMLFHMLKKRLGEGPFQEGLRHLYQSQRGKSISYEEIEASFTSVSGENLQKFFQQWVKRAGAPRLELTQAHHRKTPAGEDEVDFELRQASQEPYELLIPVRFTFADQTERRERVLLRQAHESFHFRFSQPVVRLEVDPEMDVFRDLAPQERPLSLSSVFGARNIWVLGTGQTDQNAYLQAWRNQLDSQIHLADASLLEALPKEGAVVLLGESPLYESWMLQQLAGQDVQVSAQEIRLFGTPYSRQEHRTVLVARALTRPDVVLVWIRGTEIASLAPRLLHYGKYGVLVFAEKNLPLKTNWPLRDSPLQKDFPQVPALVIQE